MSSKLYKVSYQSDTWVKKETGHPWNHITNRSSSLRPQEPPRDSLNCVSAVPWQGVTTMTTLIEQPRDLVSSLLKLFPSFADECDEGESLGYENQNYSFHSIVLTFSPLSAEYLEEADQKTIQAFGDLVNCSVENGGELENAFSTCFATWSHALTQTIP